MRAIELPGASCLDTWKECWAVFRTAAIMASVALPGVLDRYADTFAERCKRYPTSWHLCAQADIRCRTEQWVAERRAQDAFVLAQPGLAASDPMMPWNNVIRASTTDTEFWDRELKEPALLHGRTVHAATNPSFVTQLPGQVAAANNKRKRGGRNVAPAQAPSRATQQSSPSGQS